MRRGFSMKRAIVTYVDGDDFEEMLELVEWRMKDYAHKCGADFVVVRGGARDDLPIVMGKCKCAEVFTDYDFSIFLDVDIIIQNNPPVFFDLYQDPSKVYGFDEQPHLHHFDWFWRFNRLVEHRKSQQIKEGPRDGHYTMNTGMFQLGKQNAHLFRYPEHPVFAGFNEQGLWNVRIQEADCYVPVSLRWNCIRNLECFWHEYRDAYFVHFNIKPNEKRLWEMNQLIRSEAFDQYLQ